MKTKVHKQWLPESFLLSSVMDQRKKKLMKVRRKAPSEIIVS
jgi:hypothetical protein